MNDTLFLTTAEREQFARLPLKADPQLIVTDETSSAYETDEQLEIRMQIATFKDNPAVVALAEAMKAGAAPETWPDMPNEILPELYFSIGARGLSAVIGALLERAADADDIAMLSALTMIRHEVLMTNESVSENSPSPL